MDGSISGCSESRDSMFPGFLPVTGHGVDRNVCGCRKSVCHKKHLMMEALGLEPGGIVKLAAEKDGLRLRKVHLIEMGDLSPEAVEAYVKAATARMPREKQIELAARLLEQARKEVDL